MRCYHRIEKILMFIKKEYDKKHYLKNKIKRNTQNTAYYRANHKRRSLIVAMEVLAHYGNGLLACVKCNFNDVRALCIDHIDGGGSSRKFRQIGQERGRGGVSFYA